MNHLAHIYLSGNNDDLIIGNYIADFVKGKKLLDYSEGIQKGIMLHRSIDSYTDQHPLVKTSLGRVREDLGKFAGIAVDVYYDYFLASHWHEYHEEDLESFAERIYALIKDHYPFIPQHAQRFYQYMVAHNLLVTYRDQEILWQVFFGLSRRTRFPSQLAHSVDYLNEHYDGLYDDFKSFFEDLRNYTQQRRLELK